MDENLTSGPWLSQSSNCLYNGLIVYTYHDNYASEFSAPLLLEPNTVQNCGLCFQSFHNWKPHPASVDALVLFQCPEAERVLVEFSATVVSAARMGKKRYSVVMALSVSCRHFWRWRQNKTSIHECVNQGCQCCCIGHQYIITLFINLLNNCMTRWQKVLSYWQKFFYLQMWGPFFVLNN